MMAFWNKGLGYDRYAEVFDQKETLGKKMKDPNATELERQRYAVQREGTKLLLNSASGAANATFESPIRLDNQIIKMRVLGQWLPRLSGNGWTLCVKCSESPRATGCVSRSRKRQTEEAKAETKNCGWHMVKQKRSNRVRLLAAS